MVEMVCLSTPELMEMVSKPFREIKTTNVTDDTVRLFGQDTLANLDSLCKV